MNIQVENVKVENLTICNGCDDKFTFPDETNPLKIDSQPQALGEIKNRLRNPNDLDDITQELGIPSNLVNFHLAVPINLSQLNIRGLDNVISIPVSISRKDGGRSSIYKLEKGKPTLTGIYVNSTGILMNTMERLGGDTETARVGDSYKLSLTNLKGKLFYQGVGTLDAFDKEKGAGKFHFHQTDIDQVASRDHIYAYSSVFWSMIPFEFEYDS